MSPQHDALAEKDPWFVVHIPLAILDVELRRTDTGDAPVVPDSDYMRSQIAATAPAFRALGQEALFARIAALPGLTDRARVAAVRDELAALIDTRPPDDQSTAPWTREPTWIDPAIAGADPVRVHELVTAAADKDICAWARTDWFLPRETLSVVSVRRVRGSYVVIAQPAQQPVMYSEPCDTAAAAFQMAEVAIWVVTIQRWKAGDPPLWHQSAGETDLLAEVRKAKPGAVLEDAWLPSRLAASREQREAANDIAGHVSARGNQEPFEPGQAGQ